MSHAWLDSLSEDWVSQPGCDTSADKLPPLEGVDNAPAAQRRDHRSRIPRRSSNAKASFSSSQNTTPYILSERSPNGINIFSQRLPSKPSQATEASRVTTASRYGSMTTNGSVLHNSHRRHVSSRRKSETPEWKRRLVHGKVGYGEQRDLFCSAAAGLQDMFRPPLPGGNTVEQSETTLPSSPPPYLHQDIDADAEHVALEGDDDADGRVVITPSPCPRRPQREIRYRLNMDDSMPPSNLNDSTSGAGETSSDGRRQHEEMLHDESCLAVPHDAAADASRKTSGQCDTRNEDFSPILIGRHSDKNGGIDFAPMDVPVEQLKQKLEDLRIKRMLLDSQEDLRAGFDPSDDNALHVETTEDHMRNGGFVNMQRGGRSGDGSFYNRGLSSELGVDSSEMLPEESLQASTPKQFPTLRTQGTLPRPTIHVSHSPSLPRAPFPSPEKQQAREAVGGHTASSPLKLFGPYDTFTNQTLLRRISQFEETSGSHSRPSLDSDSRAASQQSHQDPDKGPSVRNTRAISQFGGGELDGYEFTGDLSYESSQDLSVHDKESFAPATDLSDRPSIHSPRESPPDDEPGLLIRRRRNKSLSSAETASNSKQKDSGVGLTSGAPASAGTPRRNGDLEAKRPRTSPSKDPTPKRRRTLHRSDVAFGREDRLVAVDSAHRQMQIAMGKKRKDARPGDFELADPGVLAMRSILWPRSCTPSLRLSHHGKKPDNLPIRTLQSEHPGPPSDDQTEAERKPSIRTQDFVDQAAQIMAMIRSQVRPGLASLEESEAQNDGASLPASLTDSYQESTNEPFSRPPSREGKPLPRIPQRQEDPELVSRLRQYQERSDLGDVLSSSQPSVSLAKNVFLPAHELDGRNGKDNSAESDGPIHVSGDIVSDLPNVRITSRHTQDKEPLSPNKDFPTDFSGRSTSRSFPTTSSRGSESRRTIMPQSVSHLIPDKVGSMYLDKQNNIWVKKKVPRPASPANAQCLDDSEEDPFASIPDLTVDMTKELQNLRLAAAQRETVVHDAELQRSAGSASSTHGGQPGRGYGTLSPKEKPGPHIAAIAREQLDRLEERATMNSTTRLQGVERDLSETHGSVASDVRSTTRRRNLTISFSSPIASIIYDVVAADLEGLEDDPDGRHRESHAGAAKPALKKGAQASSRAVAHGRCRPASARGPDFMPRPVSRIDEQDEESTVEIQPDDNRQVSLVGENSIVSHKTPEGRHASLSLVLNHTPNNNRALAYQQDDSAVIGRNVGKLSLSPLSEFTLNNSDPSFGFEVSYVMSHRHLVTGDGSKRVMSMSIRELVDKLGEVEPYEPFWEDITELDLHDKQLTSLHMLDEFCGRVVALDASKNKLGHLDGIPSTVRQLKAADNMLTELTSWDHLMNLQYVDISGNEVKSLSALKNMVHLRSIRADNCQLTSLDGLDCHDGLLSLRARNNLIEELDFSKVMLKRLTELDVEGNSISSIRKLELLPALSRLRLRRNRLRQLSPGCRMEALRQLDVSDNRLTSLDLSKLPSIRSVHADRNCICRLSGFERARRLDSLSLREQDGGSALDVSFLASAYEIRKLFLSGNYLGCFEPMVDFLNLQLLDLANCGLQRLPEKMGQLMPNLRTLNINFNAIADLSPLQFIPRLKKLLAAGNRLADSTAVTQLLTDFPHLAQLDVRDNPVTLGFYAPVQILVPTEPCGHGDPFALPDADAERDGLFASRLDEATRLRRRLHQIVLAASCRRLRKLDGLAVRRREVLAKDDLVETLVAEGLVPELEETLVAPSDELGDDEAARAAEPRGDAASWVEAAAETQAQAHTEDARQNCTGDSGRWSREDSFA